MNHYGSKNYGSKNNKTTELQLMNDLARRFNYIQNDNYKRGLKKGNPKIQTPRLLKVFLSCVVPSRRGYSKYKDKKEAKKVDPIVSNYIHNESKIETKQHGYVFTLEGYMNTLGLDILILLIDEALQKDTRELTYKAYDFIKLLGIDDGGQSYDRIFEQINKLANIGLIFSNKIKTKKELKRTISTKLNFIYLIAVTVEEIESKEFANQIDREFHIELSENFFNSIKNFFTLVDWKIYKSIESSPAKLLYLLLRLSDYGHEKCYMSIKKIFEALNIAYDRNYKTKLKKIVKEIEKSTLQTIEITYHEDGKRILINYHDKAVLSPPSED